MNSQYEKLGQNFFSKFTQCKFCRLLFFGVLRVNSSFSCVFQDYDKLASFVSTNYGTKLEKVDLSVKGWNWGVAKFEGKLTELLIRGED